MSLLADIIESKKREVATKRDKAPVTQLGLSEYYDRRALSLEKVLGEEKRPGVIAEFKRKSPSKGEIASQANLLKIISGYESAGAAAVSILTDSEFFGGSVNDIEAVRESVSLPILRKDFIIDEYQIYESKAVGADVILLIAAILEKDLIAHFIQIARLVGLEVLLEVHSLKEFEEKYVPGVTFLGINNRNLDTLEVSVQTSYDLITKIPRGQMSIAESGISDPEEVIRLHEKGFDGFLIGEHFMIQEDPSEACKSFLSSIAAG